MLLIFALFIAVAIAASVFAVEYSDRLNQQKLRDEAEYWRGQVEEAQRQHAPRKELFKQLVEARRRELSQ